MKQQLLFAMAIVNEPEFLVLDEPFNGLDPRTIIKVRKILMDLQKKETTIFLSSHNLAEVDQMTSQIVFVKDGKLIEEDISKYQEDVYYFKVKNIKESIEKLDSKVFQVSDDEIVARTHDTGLQKTLNDINVVDEIVSIRKEVIGAERRYEALFGE